MKNLWVVVTLFVFLAGCTKNTQNEVDNQESLLPSDLTNEELSLLSDVRQMFHKNDVTSMLNRVHKDRVEDWWMKIERDYLEDVLEQGLGRLELVRINPPREEETLMDGSVAEWSLPLKWQLIIHHPVGVSGMNVSHTISLSDHEGRIVSIRQISKQSEQVGAPNSLPAE